MHAASVHPEPGSNSRNNFIISDLSVIIFFRAIYLSFFYFVWVYINSFDEICISHLLMLCTSLLLFNFQWPFACPPLFSDDSLTIIPHRFFLVNTFFKISLKKFSKSFRRVTPSLDGLTIIPLCLLTVKWFFYCFFNFVKIPLKTPCPWRVHI